MDQEERERIEQEQQIVDWMVVLLDDEYDALNHKSSDYGLRLAVKKLREQPDYERKYLKRALLQSRYGVLDDLNLQGLLELF